METKFIQLYYLAQVNIIESRILWGSGNLNAMEEYLPPRLLYTSRVCTLPWACHDGEWLQLEEDEWMKNTMTILYT